MNALFAAFLGAGGLAGLGSLFYTIYKDVRDRRRVERKAEGEIQLDTVTEQRIAAEAAQINSDVAIAQQTWWRQQFSDVRAELVLEQRRTRSLLKWARQHQIWDEGAWERAVKSDPDYPRPPVLENGNGDS